MRRARSLAGLLLGLSLVASLGACSSSGSSTDPSKLRLTSDDVKPGEGVLQLGAGRYPFAVVNCGTGAVEAEDTPLADGSEVPAGAERDWGLYGNGYTEGKLFTVAISQYRTTGGGGVVTVTQTVLVRMDVPADTAVGSDTTVPGVDVAAPTTTTVPADGSTVAATDTADSGPAVEHLGLTAQRFRPASGTTWTDPRDRAATNELVRIDGATYTAVGRFGPSGADSASVSTEDGQVTARCPDKEHSPSTTG